MLRLLLKFYDAEAWVPVQNAEKFKKQRYGYINVKNQKDFF